MKREAERKAAYKAFPCYRARFEDPVRRAKYLAAQREYHKKRRQREKAARYAEEVAYVTGV